MLFNTFEFLVFFIITFGLFFSIPSKRRWVVLLLASYFFYGFWKFEYLFLIAGSTLVDYFISNSIGVSENQRKKKILLFISISLNMSLLFLFKYFDFSASSSNVLFDNLGIDYKIKLLDLVLPVGISFYTFQTMSYTIDVYNGKIKPERHIGIFALFVSFFPQLVAGPIERASNLLPQLNKSVKFDIGTVSSGAQLVLWGLVKKVVVADRVGLIANEIFNNYADYQGLTLVIGTVFFAFQIYCDFSGYSDIAIGLARMFGYELMKNFNSPYFSFSLTDFWRRWHMSLSGWFKDYVYIPLGGNKVIKWRWYFNLWITFFISGIWHGANWTFVIWGCIHGIGLVVENMILKKVEKGSFFRKLFVFSIVCLAWVFFRANTVNDAFYILGSLLRFSEYNLSQLSFYIVPGAKGTVFSMDFVLSYFVVLMLLFVEHQLIIKKRWEIVPNFIKPFIWSLAIVSLFLIGVFEVDEFIYFQF